MKIPPALEELLEEGLIDDVHRQLLSGKEASVYVVSRDGMAIAAKVYKERNNRTFKNVTSYVEGRNQTRNTRDKRAKSRKTKYGRELLEQSWRSMEHDALQRAFMGGVRVPEPYLLSGDVLLMEYLCDEDGEPAPRLSDIEIPYEVAKLLHLEVYQQTRRMLAAGLIHGDLSAFNVLVAPNGLTIIDLPQVVDASANSEAKELLLRDLRNVTEFFARFDAGLLEFLECGEGLWNHYTRGTLDKAEEPEKARSNRRAGRGRRGRAGEGGLGAREDKHANRPKRAPPPRDNSGRSKDARSKDERSNRQGDGANGGQNGGQNGRGRNRSGGRARGEAKPRDEAQKRNEGGGPPRNRPQNSDSQSEPAANKRRPRNRAPADESRDQNRDRNDADRAPSQRRRGPPPRREVEIERAPARPLRSGESPDARPTSNEPADARDGNPSRRRGGQGRGGQGRGGQGRGGQGGGGGQGRGGEDRGAPDRAPSGERPAADPSSDNAQGEGERRPRRRRRRPSAPDNREP